MIRYIGLRIYWVHNHDEHTGYGIVRAGHKGLKLEYAVEGTEENEPRQNSDMTVVLIYKVLCIVECPVCRSLPKHSN